MINYLKQNKGFTLIEALVAIFLLTVAIVGPMTLASKGLSSAYGSKNQIIAMYLAQEGVEIIRALRDDNVMQGNYWTEGFSDCYSDATNDCNVDGITFTVQHNKYDMYVDSDGIYSCVQTSGSETIFDRKITLVQVDAEEIRVESTVSWKDGVRPVSVTIRDNLFNWK